MDTLKGKNGEIHKWSSPFVLWLKIHESNIYRPWTSRLKGFNPKYSLRAIQK